MSDADDSKRAALVARVDAARARSAAVAAARAVVTDADLEGEALAAEREAKDAEAIMQAECKHGRVGTKIAVVSSAVGSVIVRRAPAAMFHKFQDAGTFTTATATQLVNACREYPTADEFDAMVAQQPALITQCADAIAVLAGVRRAEIAGK